MGNNKREESNLQEDTMGFQYVNNLPTPDEIKERFPLPAELKERKAKRDQEVSDVLTGKSDKFLVIIGPCSAGPGKETGYARGAHRNPQDAHACICRDRLPHSR